MSKISFKTYGHRDRYREIRDGWADCRACPLADHRYQLVHLRGEVPATVAFLGEGPGPSENLMGFPFVGPAGDLMDEMILAALEASSLRDKAGDLLRPRMAFLNLVACLPHQDGGGVRPPKKSEAKACSPRVEELLDLLEPEVIIRVGRTPGQFLPQWKDARLVTVPHPAGILRILEDNPTKAALDQKRFHLTLLNALNSLEDSHV